MIIYIHCHIPSSNQLACHEFRGNIANHNMAGIIGAVITMTSATPPPASDADDQRNKVKQAVIADIDEEDELFELDISLLDGGRGDSHSAAVAGDDGGDAGGHALLANCLLPARSVSKAVPVDASGALTSSYPYSGYYSSRRLIFTGGGIGVGRRFLFGRSAAGNSARFCFSGRGFDTYFQRY